MRCLTIYTKRSGPIRGRHPWVFSGAFKHIPEDMTNGEAIQLLNEEGNFLAGGYFNSYSQITARLWTWQEDEIVDESFFEKRIKAAQALRQELVQKAGTDSFRLINGEGDLLPGCIIDVYGEYAVVQFHNSGIARWSKEIVAALVKTLRLKGIYERSDVRDRKRIEKGEGIEQGKILFGKIPETIIARENGYQFYVDTIGGQKTGFFLDQRDKRQALQKYVGAKKVLNCFSYTGGFSVYALAADAEKVVSVDASRPALELAEKNVVLNKLDATKAEFILADVKEYLADRRPGEFDVIVLDPPAFVKDRHKLKEGLHGYRSINEQALKVLPPGGILVTCSCSAHVSLTDFRFMLSEAAARAGRTVQILETYTHGIDHPELAAFTEGDYLKCLFCKVL